VIYSPLLDLSTWGRKRFFSYDKITRLFQLDISYHRTLGDLKLELLNFPEFSKLPSPKHLRIWHHSRILKRDDQTLRQQYLGGDTPITIQVLRDADALVTGEEAVIYVHRRNGQNNFDKPKEIIFSGSGNRELAEALGPLFDIPLDHLLVARYTLHLGVWEVVFEGFKSTIIPTETEAKETKQEVKPSGAGKESRARASQKPMAFLTDGAILAVKDLRSDPDYLDDFTLKPIRLPSTSLPEEGGGTTFVSRGRPREADLVIHVSDDEYEFQDVEDD